MENYPKYAKPIEEILKAPANIQQAMLDYLEYMDYSRELHDDITDRFNYPSLWAAIDRLIYLELKEQKAYLEMEAAGYTFSDAYALLNYENSTTD